MDAGYLNRLVGHPERMNSDTLYLLRTVVARYPYFQTARLLMLSNLYLLHDPDFSTEFQRSVFYITDRRVLWQLVNGIPAYPFAPSAAASAEPSRAEEASVRQPSATTDMQLIDAYLDAQPAQTSTLIPDAPVATDYLATLGWTLADDADDAAAARPAAIPDALVPIVSIRPVASDERPATPSDEAPETLLQPEFLTETLARIYIKQKKYDRALAIIRSLYLNFPEKSIYFADQIRFLEKLVRNNQSKKDK